MSLELPATVEEIVELLELIPHPEGGFFRETYRSGATPMASRGQTDFDVKPEHLVTTTGRESNRDDRRRNALTSIYWMPTRKSPYLPMVFNQSAHIHNYHGGLPFQFKIYDPTNQTVTTAVLGPNLKEGHRPQVIVDVRMWKTGRVLTEYSDKYDYCLIGESVAPGFDVCDFATMSQEQFDLVPTECRQQLESYFAANTDKANASLEFDSHYDDDDKKRNARAKERI